MPIVLYTNEKFDVGSIVDTRDYCDLNQRALEEATREEQEVEAFLEEVRAEHFPVAPDRVCSVLGIPISTSERTRAPGGLPRLIPAAPTPEPPGIGTHCYHITEAPGAKRLIADEGYVGHLVAGWDELRDRFERWDIANAYWSGHILSGYSVLIKGPVKIVDECRNPHGGRRLKPVIWEAE